MISGNRANALRNVVHRSRRFMPSGTVQDIWSSFRPLLQDTNKIDAQEVGCQLSVHILCTYPELPSFGQRAADIGMSAFTVGIQQVHKKRTASHRLARAGGECLLAMRRLLASCD